MDGSIITKIRDNLLERRAQIGTDLAREREAGSDLDLAGHQAEIVDIAQALEQLDRNSSLAEQERRELAAIEKALAKMATGSFGVCEDCDEEIPSKRMLIVPHARLCAKCQEFEEKQQGRSRGMPTAVSR
jgi:DnaK suppressor protein